LVLYSPWYKKIEGRGTERRSRGERRETIKFFLKVQQHTTVDWFCSNDHNGVSGYWYEKGINVDQLAPEIGPIIAEVSRFGRGRGELEIEKRIGGEEEEKRRGKEGRGEKEKRGMAENGNEREKRERSNSPHFPKFLQAMENPPTIHTSVVILPFGTLPSSLPLFLFSLHISFQI